MSNAFEGLPAAVTIQQAIFLAQLQILRRLERQRHGLPATGCPATSPRDT
jgi:hypothetical protein